MENTILVTQSQKSPTKKVKQTLSDEKEEEKGTVHISSENLEQKNNIDEKPNETTTITSATDTPMKNLSPEEKKRY